jgi:17beta-estradiol 17-dehydrogenase / very-long-chain 3-oxoacyl-CoA reductase
MEVLCWFWLLGLVLVLARLAKFIKLVFFSHLDINQFKYGWVAITGASDGIGKGFAQELYNQGFKLILIARNPEKLAQTREEIMQKGTSTTSPEVEIVVADFSTSHHNPEEFYTQLASRLSHYEISVLINNVGVGHHGDFETQDLKDMENLLAVNLYPMTFLSHALIPSFLQRFEQTQRRSLILNISSIFAIKSPPGVAVYSATKAYNDFLSRALSYEYSKAITVTSLRPGFVVSQITKKANLETASVSAEDYAKQSLKRLGANATSGHLSHMIQAEILDLLPQSVMNLMGKKLKQATKKTK